MPSGERAAGLQTPRDKKNPAFRRDFPALTLDLRRKLAIPLRGLALTVRILLLAWLLLLLLAGLCAAALLLTGLLTRILVLLAGLVLVGHLGISLVERSGK
jgi:hypothetical protein